MISNVRFLFSLKGNAKACLLTEPMWGIPFNLYAPFMTLYMYHLGVMDVQIGIILSAARIVMIFSAIAAGVITDKYGRRKVTLIGDILSWSIPALLWAFSQNFWWFMTAALINGLWHITSVSWECLWVDDCDEEQVGPIFNWIYIAGLLAVFFAPISVFFVHTHGVVPVVRILYMITFVSMTAKFVILYIYSTETERGKERMEVNKNVRLTEMFKGYKDVLVQLFRSRMMVQALVLQSVMGVIMLITGTFFALYATQDLLLPEAMLAIFPILRAGVMLLFLMVIQEKLSKFKARHMMLAGIVVYIAAMAWLLGTPLQYNVIWLGVYIVMEACAAAMFLPRLDTLAANAIDPQERARIRSLFNTIIMAVSAPFGFFAGLLSDMDRRLPFTLALILFVVMFFVIILGNRERELNA